jgi:hypothetical protein
VKQFIIKGAQAAPSVLELIGESESGFRVRITHARDGWEDVEEEFMSHELFETCIRTGYLAEMSA